MHVWPPHCLPGLGKEAVWSPVQRAPVRRPPVHEAHLRLPGASLRCLSPPGLLPPSRVCMETAAAKLCQAGWRHCGRRCCCLWPLCAQESAAPDPEQALPLPERLVPCVLGAQRLGHLLFRRPGSDLPYALLPSTTLRALLTDL